MHVLRRLLISLAATLGMATSAVTAQNLLQNPAFDTSVAGWSFFGEWTSVVWDSFDRNGDASSGSALVTGRLDPGPPVPMYHGAQIYQCVSVLPEHSYVFGASVWLDSPADIAPIALLEVDVSVLWVLGPDCMGPGVPGSSPNSPTIGSTWMDVQASMTAPTGAISALLSIAAASLQVVMPRIYVDDAYFIADATCIPTASQLCLAAGRFRAFGSWRVPADSRIGYMRAFPLTSESGLFWFFSAQNPEIITKVLNACGDPFQHYWVFAAGLTNVETSLSVVDTVSGEIRNYLSPFGPAFAPIQDTSAFATCP